MTGRSNLGSGEQIPTVSVEEAWGSLTDKRTQLLPLLVDVREQWEYFTGHAAHAINIPLSELSERIAEVPRNRDVLLICHIGERSMVAARLLRQQGVRRVFNIGGGTDAWIAAQLPFER